MIELISNIISGILSLLPDSPIQTILGGTLLEYLAYINYFVPFDIAKNITKVWVDCIVAFYLYSLTKNVTFKYGLDMILSKL